MSNGTNGNGAPPEAADTNVREVVRCAEQELRRLLQQRAETMKRIGTLKQTLAGLANIFGDSVLPGELLALLDRRASTPAPGLTRACRLVLMDAAAPLSAHQVCERLQERVPGLLERHKNPIASITTVLSRLVDYAEAQTFPRRDGRRAWLWIADAKHETEAQQGLPRPEKPGSLAAAETAQAAHCPESNFHK